MAPLVATAGMLIRRPAREVFRAFVDPQVTTRFWFTRSSGPLTPGATLRWEWEMYGAGADVIVKAVEHDARILIDWGAPGAMSEVEWTFAAHGPDRAWAEVVNRAFPGDLEAQTASALDSAGGFALVLAGAKLWLEQGVAANLIADRHPAALVAGWTDRA